MLRVVGVATAASLVIFSSTQAKSPTGKCRSPRGTVVAKSPLAVAYKIERAVNGFASDELMGCLRSTGRRRVLTEEDAADRPPRAVAVHGSAIGYPTLELSDIIGQSDSVIINIEFLKKPRRSSTRQVYLPGSSSGEFSADPAIGGLDVTNRGVAAWVECPDVEFNGSGSMSECLHTRTLKRVIAVATGPATVQTRLVELGRGHTIVPRSVRIRRKNRAKQSVSWVQEGRRRSRPFPPATTLK